MKAPKPVSNERLKKIERLLSREPSGDFEHHKLAFALADMQEELAEICKELLCWRSAYGND
jgi:hypothetical protein